MKRFGGGIGWTLGRIFSTEIGIVVDSGVISGSGIDIYVNAEAITFVVKVIGICRVFFEFFSYVIIVYY